MAGVGSVMVDICAVENCPYYLVYGTQTLVFSKDTFMFYCISNVFLAFSCLFIYNNQSHYTFKLLKTRRNTLYIRNQSVPRSKHFPPRL